MAICPYESGVSRLPSRRQGLPDSLQFAYQVPRIVVDEWRSWTLTPISAALAVWKPSGMP